MLAAAWLLAAGAPSPAQTVDAGGDSPARFIPADDLVFYGEFDGLDAHSRGWQKTAAYRLLNETPTGAMLEDLFLQIYPRRPWRDLSAPEALQLIKHVAKSGVVISENCWSRNGEKKSVNALILRDAFSNKDVRPIFARLLQGLPAPDTKPQAVVKLGHKMISGKLKDGDTFYWWVEETKKADLIIVFGIPEAPDYLIDTLDGKKPSALTNPSRVELTKPRDGFERTGCLMIDPEKYGLAAADHPVVTTFNQINTRRLDFLCGFQGDALATITRFHQKPNPTSDKSIAALFDKTTIPPIPSGVVGLTVLALDMKAVPAQIHKIKAISDRYDQFVATLKQKAKIRLEEDVLGQLGPKITAYIAPSKTPAAAPAVPNAPSLFARMGAGGADALPKVAILIDVANPVTFAKTLDELMGFVNRQLKTAFAPPAGPENEGAAAPDRPGRGRGPGAPPALEFRVMAGETKSYVLNVPPELSNVVPAGLRPTIRVGPKQVAIAATADGARQAIEAKGTYTPPSEISAAFGRVPAKLNWLLVHDPRDSTPPVLAALPAKLQVAINMITLAANGGTGTPPPPTTPASPTPLVLQVDPSKLPAVEDIKKLLFPAIYTIDEEGDAIRFTSRTAFPPIPDPLILGQVIRAARQRANPNAAAGVRAPSRAVTDGFSDVPAPPSSGRPPRSPGGELGRRPQ